MPNTLENYLGIDPGINGGLALVRRDRTLVLAHRMPGTLNGKLLLFRRLLGYGVTFAVLEQVHTSPQMGVVSAGTFMRGVGNLEAFLHAAGIHFIEVTPQKWMKAMGCMTRGDKNVTLAAAKQRFPKATVNHTIADALLIADYARLINRPSTRQP